MNFHDEMSELEKKAKDEGWDKKAEAEIKQRMEKRGQQNGGQSQPGNNQQQSI